MRYEVRRINKNGTVSKMKLTNYEKIYHTFTDISLAFAKIEELEKLNPGKKWIIYEY